MKLEFNLNIRDSFVKATAYLKRHTDQAVVVSILVIVTIAALLSSFLFYRFALSPQEPTEREIGYKEIKARAKDSIYDNIEEDKKISLEEKNKLENITEDPFK